MIIILTVTFSIIAILNVAILAILTILLKQISKYKTSLQVNTTSPDQLSLPSKRSGGVSYLYDSTEESKNDERLDLLSKTGVEWYGNRS